METGSSRTFVIAWTQVQLDELVAAPMTALTIGATWRWSGEAVAITGPRDVLVLDNALGAEELHHRAAQAARKIVGTALAGGGAQGTAGAHIPIDGHKERLFDGGFDVTDGVKRYEMTLIDMDDLGLPLVMCVGEMPPADTDLWVVETHVATVRESHTVRGGGVICFTQGTMIDTPDGMRRVEDLSVGDWVQTKDNGAQQLVWTGGRRITGARLYAMPELRPIRLRAGALGHGVPDGELLVSPDHRFLIQGAVARDLFNADEVLVAARDLVNDQSVLVDHSLKQLTYTHLMFDSHQVIFANGLETESFHPAFANLSEMPEDQRAGLFEVLPDLALYEDAYGPSARRTLSSAETAILIHNAA